MSSKKFYEIYKVEDEKRAIEDYKIYPARLPAEGGAYCRTDKEGYGRVISGKGNQGCYYIDNCGDVGYIKVIGAV